MELFLKLHYIVCIHTNYLFRFAFQGLKSTRFLYLANNQLSNTNSSSSLSFFGLFKELVNLEEIDFSNNLLNFEGESSIKLFETQILQKGIKTFQLFKGVDEILYDREPILPCLRRISFDNNPITSIEKNFFLGLRESNLQEISFQDCSIKSIHIGKRFLKSCFFKQ